MRILVDTNIFISREDHVVVPENLQRLLNALHKLNAQVLIHPLSVEEIQKNGDAKRRQVKLSKIKTYVQLEDPPDMNADRQFLDIIGEAEGRRELIDNNLLYCVHRDAVDFLITEDKSISEKAERMRLKQRVFNVHRALEHFEKVSRNAGVSSPPAISQVPVHNLDIDNPILDSLKQDYPEFREWWQKISREGRRAWVYLKSDGHLGALLIYKKENEPIQCNPPLPRKTRVKICTIKVAELGQKIGELFLKIAIQFAIRNDIFEIYLTRFTKPQDELVSLISEFGFSRVAQNDRGEDIYLKKLVPDRQVSSLIEVAKRFYPSFCDGPQVRKFIVPIRPQYHDRLFTDYKHRQTYLPEYVGGLIVEGNTIGKAYLCHSRITAIFPGDILLFYRSGDEKALTSLGVIEGVRNTRDPQKIIEYTGKRTVYTRDEIEKMTMRPTKVVMFRWHFHLGNRLKLTTLVKNGILQGPPMSMMRISHSKYNWIKTEGEIDVRFTVS